MVRRYLLPVNKFDDLCHKIHKVLLMLYNEHDGMVYLYFCCSATIVCIFGILVISILTILDISVISGRLTI